MVSPPRTLKALCLHSFRTNGKIFEVQMLAKKQLSVPHLDCAFSESAFVCGAADEIPSVVLEYFPVKKYGAYRQWWATPRDAAADDDDVEYVGFDAAIAQVSKELRSGNYDGLVGFSQGGALAAAVVAKQLQGRADHPPLAWAWLQSAFVPRDSKARALFDNAAASSVDVLISTHASDGAVDAARTRALCATFSGASYVEFAGAQHSPARLDHRGGDANSDAVLEFFKRQTTRAS
ncbi:serine hydrolase FSH [Pelagophyceae sp. CCMP2097]|nr:serine hydrolase FSH [Pelagophyceae sp. CCMP2097]|mmetsp:Transcript_10682/g.36934  ORF Transcript_10682/g.36934 Transcript_10682/m.36934 type:complete len:235 (+) Transcript_10682:254-958(+)